MAATAITHSEDQNRRKGAITSFFIHLALLAIALLPLMTFPDPPPGQEGILVALGEPDEGQGDEKPAISPAETEPVEEETPDAAEPEEVVEPEPVKEEPKKTEPKKEEPKKVNTDDNSRELALKKAKEKKEKAEKLAKERAEAKEKAERDAKIKAEKDAIRKKAEAAAKKKAEAEAKKKAEEARKKAEADKLKSNIGDMFGGSGQGNKDKPGSQGDPNGDPNANKLDGISTGSGTIGGGLGNRGGSGPRITDSSQETGKVVVYVCVDEDGKVISAKFTQKGSTSTSSRLKSLAVANAKKYTFSKGSVDKQCGTITYDFKVK